MSSSVALTPPSSPPHLPASSPGLVGSPRGIPAPCVYIPVPVVGHMCTKIDVAGRSLMYCVCDREALATAHGAVG